MIKYNAPPRTSFEPNIFFRWVNNQDFSRASPEPPIHGDANDIYKALLQPQNAMQAMPILHPHALLHKVKFSSKLFCDFFFDSNSECIFNVF